MPRRLSIWLVLVILYSTSTLYGQPAALFRDGFVITQYGDTLRGKIKNTSESGIIFMDGQKNKREFTPDDLRGFVRCGMVYASEPVPGDTGKIFIALLVAGALDLYGTVYPENYNEAAITGMVGGAVGGLAGAAVAGGLSSPGAGTRESECPDDRYSIGTFYLKKGPAGDLRKVPNGRKKFNEFMIPLMRDHIDVVKAIPDEQFFAGNTISIVRQYNAAAARK